MFLLLCLFSICVAKKSRRQSNDEVATAKEVQVKAWEYCEGCKATVELYAILSSDRLKQMQKSGVAQGEVMEAQTLLEGICDNPHFNKYASFIKYSCIKVLEDFRLPFLESFVGKADASSATVLNTVYSRKKEVGWFANMLNFS